MIQQLVSSILHFGRSERFMRPILSLYMLGVDLPVTPVLLQIRSRAWPRWHVVALSLSFTWSTRIKFLPNTAEYGVGLEGGGG